jgi:hypothetical protein
VLQSGPKRRREGRGLGPFSSGHLTIIIVTVVIVVAFPFAAYAVTGNNVFVTDASSGVRAKVDAKNNLNTAIHDPTSGVGAKVNGFGQVSAAVTGSVTATPTQPSGSFFAETQVALLAGGGNNIDIAGPPTGKALMLTSISVDVTSLPTPGGQIFVFRKIGGTACSNATNDRNIGQFTATAVGMQTISMPSGVPIPNGDRVCIYWNGGGNPKVGAMVYGYTVPAALCQSPNVCP